jgi:nucleotide-binding universal stress UspA family protein
MTSQVVLQQLQTVKRVRFQKILFATDFSEASRGAQAYAVALARLFEARLFAIHVENPSELMPFPDAATPYFMEKAEAAREENMRTLQDSLKHSGVPFATLLESGNVQEKLIETIQNYAIDLVVLGTHGRQALPRMILGSTAEGVFRAATCPVLTVGPHAKPSDFPKPIRHVIYATDFSDDSREAVPYAVSVAQEFQAHLTVLHVAPEMGDGSADAERVESYLKEKLHNLVPETECEWSSVDYVVEHGDPVERVLETADSRDADLIVMGVHNVVGFLSYLPGRTAYQIVCQAACPAMTIKPRQKSAKDAVDVSRITYP